MKANIEQLKKDITDAKARHAEANKDIKRIEKDMSEFSNNKDNKLAELQDSLNSLKKSLTKNSASVKELQKELQSSRLDSEQAGATEGNFFTTSRFVSTRLTLIGCPRHRPSPA